MTTIPVNKIVQLDLPIPPSVNQIWQRTRSGMARSNKYTAWLKECSLLCMVQKPGRVEGNYRLVIGAVKPDKRKRDLGNLIKAIEDMLQMCAVIEDDSLSRSIYMTWIDEGEPGTIRIVVQSA